MTLAAIVLATTLLAVSHPVEVLGGGGCPTRRFLGVYCPGCGSLRSTHSLLTGHLAAAWRFNPVMVLLGVPAAVWLAITSILTLFTGQPSRSPIHLRAWHLWAAAALLAGWGVIRNIPIAAMDWTRPPDPHYTPYR